MRYVSMVRAVPTSLLSITSLLWFSRIEQRADRVMSFHLVSRVDHGYKSLGAIPIKHRKESSSSPP